MLHLDLHTSKNQPDFLVEAPVWRELALGKAWPSFPGGVEGHSLGSLTTVFGSGPAKWQSDGKETGVHSGNLDRTRKPEIIH